MRVSIELDVHEPPAGRVWALGDTRAPARKVPFIGWLGLLRALDAVFEPAPEQGAPGQALGPPH